MFPRCHDLHAGIGCLFVLELEMREEEAVAGALNLPRQMAITGKAGSSLSKVMGNSRTRTPVAL